VDILADALSSIDCVIDHGFIDRPPPAKYVVQIRLMSNFVPALNNYCSLKK